jgi:formylglycine-generating enzyme required for sulfatase activity
MAFDVFISYSHTDKAAADAACAALESAGIRCWIAPRDVPPGSQWAGAIVGAIDRCRVMVLIFSSQANISNQIHREVERAVSKGFPIIPLRIEDVNPTGSMEYFLRSIQWLDALTPPLEKNLRLLVETVKSCLDYNQSVFVGPIRPGNTQQAVIGPSPISATQAAPEGAQHDGSSHRGRAILGALCLLIAVCGGATFFYLKYAQDKKVNPTAGIVPPPIEQRTAVVPVDEKTVVLPPAAPPPIASGPCDDGSVTVSLASRCATPLLAAEERALKPKDSFKECSNCPEMMVVPAGSFTMGSPEREKGRNKDEGPQHIVTIGQPFAVGKFHVTVAQFAAFVDETGYDAGSECTTWHGKFEERQGHSWRNPGFAQGGLHPAVCLNWNDAKAYVAWLARKTGKAYRLLTEAEWEYAARARTKPGVYPRYSFGNNEEDLCRYGNVFDQTWENVEGTGPWMAPCKDGYAYTSPVGNFAANDFGLYDMQGNADQWTEDCYHDNYIGAPADGSAWISGDCSRRVFRGGSWIHITRYLRAASRYGLSISVRFDGQGLRVGRTLTP